MRPARVAPLRQRVLPILGLVVGAAVSAEYLQAYLPQSGDLVALAGGLVVLGPLYGGAALLIRETALRAGRGWPGVLLLAAGFGLLMTSQVDRSMWRAHDPEIEYWDHLRSGTLLEPLGFAAYPVLSWVVGHVVFSIGAPLALLEGLAPRHRGRRLLGTPGLVVVAVLCATAALLIRSDPEYAGSTPTTTQTWLSLLVVLGLATLAMTAAGRPLQRRQQAGRHPSPVLTSVTAAVGLAALDVLPAIWLGVGGHLVVLTAGGWWLRRRSRSPGWGVAQVTALGVAAVVERTVLGFLAPLPSGVSVTEKVVQSVVLSGLVLTVSLIAWRRAAVAGHRSSVVRPG